MPTSPRLFRLPLVFLLLLCLAAAFLLPTGPGSLAQADAPAPGSEPAPESEPTTGDEPTEFVTADDPDPTDPDEGELAFLYTGDGMAEPYRRDFPVQPEVSPDLPFTVTDIVAVTDGPADPVVGYIWNVRNATIDPAAENTTFAFAGYAITRQPYVDVLVKGSNPGEFKIDATMFVIDTQGPIPGRLRVQLTKKGKTKVKIQDDANTPPDPETPGFVDLVASPASIGVGEYAGFVAELLTPDREHDNTSGVEVTITTPIDADPVNSVDGYATFPAELFNTANLYPVAATAEGYLSDEPNLLAVVEVASLSPDRGFLLEDLVVSGPENLETEVWWIPMDAAATAVVLSAQPNPSVSEADLPESWVLYVGEHGTPVPHANSLPGDSRTRVTVDLAIGEEVLVIAKCGTSEKRVLIQGVDEADLEGFIWETTTDAVMENLPYRLLADGSLTREMLASPGSQIDLYTYIQDQDKKNYNHPLTQDERYDRIDGDWRQDWVINGNASFDPEDAEAKTLSVEEMDETVAIYVSSDFAEGDEITVTITPVDLVESAGEGEEGTTIDENLSAVTWTIRFTDLCPTELEPVTGVMADGRTTLWSYEAAENDPTYFARDSLVAGYKAGPDLTVELGGGQEADYEGIAILERFDPPTSDIVIEDHISEAGQGLVPDGFTREDWITLLFTKEDGHSSFIIDHRDEFYDQHSGFIREDMMNAYLILPPETPFTYTIVQTYWCFGNDGENTLVEGHIYRIIRKLRHRPNTIDSWQVLFRKEPGG
ncbi:MAG: hypothetical protein AAGA29_03040 [Planctomycetota bacterium]